MSVNSALSLEALLGAVDGSRPSGEAEDPRSEPDAAMESAVQEGAVDLAMLVGAGPAPEGDDLVGGLRSLLDDEASVKREPAADRRPVEDGDDWVRSLAALVASAGCETTAVALADAVAATERSVAKGPVAAKSAASVRAGEDDDVVKRTKASKDARASFSHSAGQPVRSRYADARAFRPEPALQPEPAQPSHLRPASKSVPSAAATELAIRPNAQLDKHPEQADSARLERRGSAQSPKQALAAPGRALAELAPVPAIRQGSAPGAVPVTESAPVTDAVSAPPKAAPAQVTEPVPATASSVASPTIVSAPAVESIRAAEPERSIEQPPASSVAEPMAATVSEPVASAASPAVLPSADPASSIVSGYRPVHRLNRGKATQAGRAAMRWYLLCGVLLLLAVACTCFAVWTASGTREVPSLASSPSGSMSFAYTVQGPDGRLHEAMESVSFGDDGLVESSAFTIQAESDDDAALLLADAKEQFGSAWSGGSVKDGAAVFTVDVSAERVDKETYRALIMESTTDARMLNGPE